MMKKVTGLVCFLMFVASASAQSVALPVQLKVEAGGWLHVKPSKIDGGTPKWRLDPELEEIPPESFLPPEIAKAFIGKLIRGPVGKYRVEAWNAKGDTASDIATCWIIIGKPGTDPPPPPPPPPPPTKIAAHITFVGPEKTQASLTTSNDLELREWLKERGIKVHVLKENDPTIATSGFTEAVKQADGVPVVVLQDSVGNILAFSRMNTIANIKSLALPYVVRK